MVVALITAGGKGTRFKSDIPKQFSEINNKPLLIYTLEKFQNNSNVDYIIVACLDEWKNYLLELKDKYNITKLKWIASNGNTQPESINNCIEVLSKNIDDEDIVMIHAGNRPLVTDEIINSSIESCEKNGHAITSIPCPEVLITKDTQNIIKRENILRVQTPQTFKLKYLIEYYNKALENNIVDIATTCDLMIKLGEKVNFIDGSQLNIKITYPEDIIMFRALLKDE